MLAGLALGLVTVGIATKGQHSTAGQVVTEANTDAEYSALPSSGINSLPIV